MNGNKLIISLQLDIMRVLAEKALKKRRMLEVILRSVR